MTSPWLFLLVPVLSALATGLALALYRHFEVHLHHRLPLSTRLPQKGEIWHLDEEPIYIRSCTTVGVAFMRDSTVAGRCEVAFDVAGFLDRACFLRKPR
jgi:hypothetical protein